MANDEPEREEIRKRVLGKALKMEAVLPGVDIGLDLDLERGPRGRDFSLVDGFAALEQSLKLAFTTALGSDIFNTSFGFDGLNALVEEDDVIMVRERVRISAIQVLRKDPRVRRIIDVKLGDGQLDAPAAGMMRELDVRVTFETVSGEQATLLLGRVITNG